MSASANYLLGPLLREVSRSFYKTLRVLPGRIRSQIGLAYLLARTTDTVADTGLVPLERRLQALHQLRQRILGANTSRVEFGELAQKQSSPAERVLLEHCEEELSLLEMTSAADLKLIRDVLDVITTGQELDLRRFGSASAEAIAALATDVE